MKTLALALATAAASLALPAAASACSCAMPGDPCAAIENADVVFIGRVVDLQPGSRDPANPRHPMARFAVAEVLHGSITGPVVLPSGNGGNCLASFAAGRDYLVYARIVGGSLEASLCSRTSELAGRQHEVDVLRERRRGVTVPRLAGRITESRQRVDGTPGSDLLPLPRIAVTARRGPDVRRAVSDADGYFVFRNLAPGDYRVTADLPPGYERVAGNDAVVRVACYADANIGVMRLPLHGTLALADGSRELNAVTIHAYAIDPATRAPSPGRMTFTYVNHLDGTWSFDGLPPGDYLIAVGTHFKPRWDAKRMPFWYPAAARPEDAAIVRVGGPAVRLALRYPDPPREVQFAGVIIGPGDRPVEGGVLLHDVDAGHGVANASADARGRFRVRGWEGRRYTITGYDCNGRVAAMSDALPVDPAAAASLRIVLTRPCPTPK
ncbi:MAG TPA: carboxypeptidase regulatory-like domain-containing protein [Vicinamibacterales bacterium]|nr:carboxypeptidase regulatory-like domain-containing protein [Vicinamibacterales bacterium]